MPDSLLAPAPVPTAHQVQPSLAVVPAQEGDRLDAVVRTALQPVVDVVRRAIVGYEALARFGAAGARGPGSVFAQAAAEGRSTELELMLVRTSLGCRTSLVEGQFLAVNVSPSVVQSREFDRIIEDCEDLHDVVLELTEHAPIADLRSIRRRLDRYRERGMRVALDDVGAGHSGLRQLLEIRPDLVKLDRSIITRVDQDVDKQAVVKSLADLSREMDIALLAEGVETQAELRCLMGLGIELVQGFLLGRPSLRRHHLSRDEWIAPLNAAISALRVPHQSEVAARTSALVRPRRPSDLSLTRIGYVSRFSAALALGNLLLPAAVVVDEHCRPVEMLVPAPDGSGPQAVQPDLMSIDLDPYDLLDAAMARPQARRLHPIVTVDADRRMVAVLTVDDIISQVRPELYGQPASVRNA